MRLRIQIEANYGLWKGRLLLRGVDLDALDLGSAMDVVYAFYVDLMGREAADAMFNAPLPGSPEAQAAEAAKHNAGLADIYRSVGAVPTWES